MANLAGNSPQDPTPFTPHPAPQTRLESNKEERRECPLTPKLSCRSETIVHLIITMIQWIRTSRLSIKNSRSPAGAKRGRAEQVSCRGGCDDAPRPGARSRCMGENPYIPNVNLRGIANLKYQSSTSYPSPHTPRPYSNIIHISQPIVHNPPPPSGRARGIAGRGRFVDFQRRLVDQHSKPTFPSRLNAFYSL